MEMKNEQIEQLKACTTVEELKVFAASAGTELTDEQAVTILDKLDQCRAAETEGKMCDDALEQTAGGVNALDVITTIGVSIFGALFTCMYITGKHGKCMEDNR